MKNVLENICYILISGCSIALVKYLCSLINKKINELQVNTELKEKEKLNHYIDVTQTVISDVVLYVTQTYTETLKKHGNFSEEAQLEAKEMAMNRAKELITEECKKAIIAVYGDLESYLDVMIESFVQSYK